MSGISLDDAKEAQEEAQSGNLRDNDAGITDDLRIDYDEHSPQEVSLHPEVLIAFDHIARISINDYGQTDNLLAEEQNLNGAGPQNYGFDVEVTVYNPEVVEGTIWVEDTDGEWPETKVMGDPEDDSNPYELREEIIREDGEIVGAETQGVGDLPGGNSWDGQQVDSFDDDYITISISSSRGRDVLAALDTAGEWFTDREGNVVEGLFEVPPNFGSDGYEASEDGYPRLTGYPELRADMVGQAGAISCFFDTDEEPDTRTSIETTLYKVSDGQIEGALTPLTSEDDAYALPTYPRRGNLFWEDVSGDDVDAGADAEPQTDDGLAEAQSMMEGGEDEEGNEKSYDELTDDAQEFVEDSLNAMEAMQYDSVTEFDDFEERVASVQAEYTINATADELASIIDERGSS